MNGIVVDGVTVSRAAAIETLWSIMRWPLLIPPVVAVAVSLALFFAVKFRWISFDVVTAWFLFVAVAFVAYVSLTRAILVRFIGGRSRKRMREKRWKIVFAEEGIELADDGQSVHLTWAAFKSFRQTRNLILLLHRNFGSVVIIPKRTMDKDTLDRVVRLLEARAC